MQKRGVLVRPIPNSVAISPPLIFTEAEVDTLTDALGQSLNATADQLINEGHSVG
jgi:adenosylmethionine-8-amino-7-oxononanoate aminotransferase